MTAPTPLTPAERKAAERQRYRDIGRRPVEVWAHPGDRARVLAYVARLNRKAERDGPHT